MVDPVCEDRLAECVTEGTHLGQLCGLGQTTWPLWGSVTAHGVLGECLILEVN